MSHDANRYSHSGDPSGQQQQRAHHQPHQQYAAQQQQHYPRSSGMPPPSSSSSSSAAAAAAAAASSSSASSSSSSSSVSSAGHWLSFLRFVQRALPARVPPLPSAHMSQYTIFVDQCVSRLAKVSGPTATEDEARHTLSETALHSGLQKLHTMFGHEWKQFKMQQHARQIATVEGDNRREQTTHTHNSDATQQQQPQPQHPQQQPNGPYVYAQQSRAAPQQQQQQQQPSSYPAGPYATPPPGQSAPPVAASASSRARPSSRHPSGDMSLQAPAGAYGAQPAPAAAAAAALAMDQRMSGVYPSAQPVAHSSAPYATIARASSSGMQQQQQQQQQQQHTSAPSPGGGLVCRSSSAVAAPSSGVTAAPVQPARHKLDAAQSHYLQLKQNGQQAFAERMAILSLMIDSPDRAPFPLPAVSLDPPQQQQLHAGSVAAGAAASASVSASAPASSSSIAAPVDNRPGAARKMAIYADHAQLHAAGLYQIRQVSSLGDAGDAVIIATQINQSAGAPPFSVRLVVPQSYPHEPCAWQLEATQPLLTAIIPPIQANVQKLLQTASGGKVMRVSDLLPFIFSNAKTAADKVRQTHATAAAAHATQHAAAYSQPY